MYRPDGAPLELLYQAAGQPLARYWYVVDGRGSVVALVNSGGAEVNYYAYDEWGAARGNRREGVPQPLRYRGYWYDGWYHGADDNADSTYHSPVNSTDGFYNDDGPLPWYWLAARYYDPYLEPDPSAQDGVRSYVYCHDAPVDCADPSGLDGIDEGSDSGGAGGAGSVLGAGSAEGVALPGAAVPLFETPGAAQSAIAPTELSGDYGSQGTVGEPGIANSGSDVATQEELAAANKQPTTA